jgi:hypothetical protein
VKRKILILTVILCTLLLETSHAAKKKTVVIIPDATTSGINLSTGKSITSYVISEFVNSGRFTVVDRKNLDSTLSELKLQMSGLTEPENTKKVGRLLNADKFVFASVSRTGGISLVDTEEKFVVKLDLNDIETAVVEASVMETVNGTNAIYQALKKGIVQVIETMALSAKILTVAESTIYLDLGSNNGLAKGRKYDIKMVTKVIKDKSGKEIFRKKEVVGSLTISDVNENSSEAEISNLNKDIKMKEGLAIELSPLGK